MADRKRNRRSTGRQTRAEIMASKSTNIAQEIHISEREIQRCRQFMPLLPLKTWTK